MELRAISMNAGFMNGQVGMRAGLAVRVDIQDCIKLCEVRRAGERMGGTDALCPPCS